MSTTQLDATHGVGQIAAEYPLATRVFARHDIDFCCGGGIPLAEACKKRGLEVDAVLTEIRSEIETTDAPTTDWRTAPLDEIIDHILVTYHQPLAEELPRIDEMARKVYSVHGEKDPETLKDLMETFAALRAELESHMAKEEQILFPMIKAGQGAMAGGPVSVMEHEHASAGAALAHLKRLTNDYTVPEGACMTWTALWHALADLETSLHEHIHLENNILFPRALRS